MSPERRPRTVRRALWPALMTGIAVLVWMAGCAVRRPQTLPAPLPSADAEAVLAQVQGINQGLKTLKGVGRLEIQTPEYRRAARAAWAGSLEGAAKFRLDIMGAGLPAVSLAGDGRRVYLRQSGDVQTRLASNPRLDDLVGLPVTVVDLLHAMAGRLPELAYQRVSVHPDPAAGGVQVVFYDRLGTPRVQAALDGTGKRLQRSAFYRPDGGLHYRIDYGGYRSADSYWLPHRIEVGDGQRICRIAVERWWPDTALNESVFVLEAMPRYPQIPDAGP
jgi:outer membrane biogenesis lipoprotein LolB